MDLWRPERKLRVIQEPKKSIKIRKQHTLFSQLLPHFVDFYREFRVILANKLKFRRYAAKAAGHELKGAINM
jgi:hypothetical protein